MHVCLTLGSVLLFVKSQCSVRRFAGSVEPPHELCEIEWTVQLSDYSERNGVIDMNATFSVMYSLIYFIGAKEFFYSYVSSDPSSILSSEFKWIFSSAFAKSSSSFLLLA